MQFNLHSSKTSNGWPATLRRVLTFALAPMLGVALGQPCAAAEVEMIGTGTFKPPSSERMANVPPSLPFSRSDLTSGTWSFLVRYEDRTADADPDPYVGRFAGAIRAFRLTVGTTTVDLPVDHAELIVSDGGLGYPERESIRIQATSEMPSGVLRVSWIQIHQTSSRMDLRGSPGLLASDAIPAPSLLANLSAARPFDRFLLLRVDSPTQVQPLLYLSSSQLSVSAKPVAAP